MPLTAALTPTMPSVPTCNPRFFEESPHSPGSTPREEIIEGLLQTKARLSPKFFYDDLGSRLFEAITELDEYYPTRTEAAIFERHAPEIAASVGCGATLIDLGAGNCAKAASLFGTLRPVRYVAVDISIGFVKRAVENLAANHPGITMAGVGMDFSTSLSLPQALQTDLNGAKPLFFYPGSSIGNFTPATALQFLRRIREQAVGGGLLIGVDLIKPADILQRAYDDALGVTAAFNRNILRNVNGIIGADFDPARWRHVALFNQVQSRVEMHLEARQDIVTNWSGGGKRHFAAGERIHTESACKYTVQSFENLLRAAGFRAVRYWTDDAARFAVFHAVS